VTAHTIAVGTHGRYLVEPPAPAHATGPAPILVGFHGYAEAAEIQLERMRAIPGPDRWRLVSVQGLHRFYQRRANEVIASWMTRQDRELAIADNLAYVAAVVDDVARAHAVRPGLVFTGFSQGVAMAFRAAVASSHPVAGVIAAGGDVPPEIEPAALARLGAALVCRGERDQFYAPATHQGDLDRLRAAGVLVQPLAFAGGHEWSRDVVDAASRFLRERHP